MAKISKKDFVLGVAQKVQLENNATEELINAVIETIAENLESGNEISFLELGIFGVQERAEREGRNPKTGEKLTIKAKKIPTFKAGKRLKDRVEG
jgi:DNA-binding protein HU-beta